jgi:Leucine Rich repeat
VVSRAAEAGSLLFHLYLLSADTKRVLPYATLCTLFYLKAKPYNSNQATMQQADDPDVEACIQRALAHDSTTTELIVSGYDLYYTDNTPPLTINDARRIIACLANENPHRRRFDTLGIFYIPLRDAAVLSVLRDGLRQCTAVKTVKFCKTELGSEGLEHLLPAFRNTSVSSLDISYNRIPHGGDNLRALLVGNDTLKELNLEECRIGPEGALGLVFADSGNSTSSRLQKLVLSNCKIDGGGIANLLLSPDGMMNNSLTDLDLGCNEIEGADGGQQVSLLLHRFAALKVLGLSHNILGPLGARALAPGLAAAKHLERLDLELCFS